MSKRTQIISTIAIAAALMAATTMMPETAAASLFRPRRIPRAPEIDPGTLSSAVALAAGGLAVLRDKLRRR